MESRRIFGREVTPQRVSLLIAALVLLVAGAIVGGIVGAALFGGGIGAAIVGLRRTNSRWFGGYEKTPDAKTGLDDWSDL
jgi:hypothetical protein